MKHLKSFEQLFENQPSYMSNAVGYYSAPVGYTIKGSELEEELVEGCVFRIAETDDEIENIESLVSNVFNESGLGYSEYYGRIGVYCDDVLVGGSTYSKDDYYNEYRFDIAMLESSRGKGLARKLVKECIKDATNLGYKTIVAIVESEEIKHILETLDFEFWEYEGMLYSNKKLRD
jgi:GNAT superfamily N-acetyltransferase